MFAHINSLHTASVEDYVVSSISVPSMPAVFYEENQMNGSFFSSGVCFICGIINPVVVPSTSLSLSCLYCLVSVP